MRIVNLPKNFYPILSAMHLRDKFWLEDGEGFELVVIHSYPKPLDVKILTFHSEGKDYKCNVWNGQDCFYLAEVQ